LSFIRWIFINVFGQLAGYREYRFRLSNGKTFVCWSRTEAVARRAFRERGNKIRANQEQIIKTITDGTEIGQQARDVPDELVRDVLTG
jgi:hypothetical protein